MSGIVKLPIRTSPTLMVAVTLPASMVTTEGLGTTMTPLELELKAPVSSLRRWNSLMEMPSRAFRPVAR